MDNGLT